MARIVWLLAALLLLSPGARAQPWPGEAQGDWVLRDFRFADGSSLPALVLHYRTLGTPHHDAAGAIDNAVLLLHGTSGTGAQWLTPSFAGELFGPGQPLDLHRFFVVMPDGIGRGGSSKPSDGLGPAFPHYRYVDIVRAEHRLLTEHLGVRRLRLLLGASMGGMQAWMWAGLYPELAELVVPMASQPVRMGGRNWLNRRIAIAAIREDPAWQGGHYTVQPTAWRVTAPAGRLGTANVRALQRDAPDVASGDALYARMVGENRADTNDALWATEAVMDYAPEPLLPAIKARVLAINSADDPVNPPELGVVEPAVAAIPGARYLLIPASATTRGHYTYEQATLWKAALAEAMR